MSSPFTGFIGVGTSVINSVLGETSAARQAVNLVGTAQGGFIADLPAFALTPTPQPVRSGAIFDAATGGHMLFFWDWPAPFVNNASTFPATSLRVRLLEGVIASLTMGSTATLAAGSQVGTLNEAPLICGSLLVLNAGRYVWAGLPFDWAGMPTRTTLPGTAGILWNDGDVVSIS